MRLGDAAIRECEKRKNSMSFCRDDRHLQVYAHLYRGEMNRLTVYRQRLDMISTWSMTLLVPIYVVYISTTGIRIGLLGMLVTPLLFFSAMEARRYQYYCISRYRVRLIEKGFYVGDILDPLRYDATTLLANRADLIRSLDEPAHVIPFPRAWAIRFHRNYIWLLYILWATTWFTPFAQLYRIVSLGGIFVFHGVLCMVDYRQPIDF